MSKAPAQSADTVVEFTVLDDAIEQFEACWLAPLWHPGTVQTDKVFQKAAFKDHMTSSGMLFM